MLLPEWRVLSVTFRRTNAFIRIVFAWENVFIGSFFKHTCSFFISLKEIRFCATFLEDKSFPCCFYPSVISPQSQPCADSLQGWNTYKTCLSFGIRTHSASCCHAEETHLPSPPRSPPPSFFLLQSLLLPISPSFPLAWDRGTCDDRGVSVGHGDPLCRRSHWPGSQCIPSRSRSPSICPVCSQDPHSCPSRAPTVQPHRGLVTLGYNGKEVRVNVPLSEILHLSFFSLPPVLILLSFYLPVCAPLFVRRVLDQIFPVNLFILQVWMNPLVSPRDVYIFQIMQEVIHMFRIKTGQNLIDILELNRVP